MGRSMPHLPSPFTAQSLAALYADISAQAGVTVAALRRHLDEFSSLPIARADLQAYREGRGAWKKLHDEVVAVRHFLDGRYPEDSRVRFPLDDQPPDAWLMVNGEPPVGIEVTAALARAGHEVAKSMAGGGAVPGFIGLQDNATSQQFTAASARGRVLHSKKGIDAAIDNAITARLSAKDQQKFAEQILVITVPLGSSPDRGAQELQARHGAKAAALPFSEVHLLDPARRGRHVQLK